MTEYILILGIFWGSGVAVTTITFPSLAACETARKEAIAEFTTQNPTSNSRARALCVPKQ